MKPTALRQRSDLQLPGLQYLLFAPKFRLDLLRHACEPMNPEQSTPPQAPSPETIARAWVAAHVPTELVPTINNLIAADASRQFDGDFVPPPLWNPILQEIMVNGWFEIAEQACRFCLGIRPDHHNYYINLALCLQRQLRYDEARRMLNRLGSNIPARYEALLILLKSERDEPGQSLVLDDFQAHILADPMWSERYHEKFLTHLALIGMGGRAFEVFRQWTAQYQVRADKLWSTGVGAMMAGAPHPARILFSQEWVALSSDPDRFIGQFHGTVQPYDDYIEQSLLIRIETAAAIPDGDLNVYPIVSDRPLSGKERVLFVSFENAEIPNDLAEHFARSANKIGLSLDLWLDTSLAWTTEFAGTSQEAVKRFDSFCAHLAATKPDVVLIDCLYPITMRGLNPKKLAALKSLYGFRLICMFRDSYKDALPMMTEWASIAETILSFDPLSPLFTSPDESLRAKAILLPVPTNYDLFAGEGPGPRDQGLVFIGNTGWQYRLAILAILMTEPIRFSAIIGARRHQEAATTADYARLLRQATASLNVSRHGPFLHLVTGRVWESISARTLLIEQDNPATATFLTPYRHYLPWRNVDDIVHMAYFIDRHPTIAAQIADDAHNFISMHYGCDRIWTGLISHALRTV
jgi:hypothetical protein